MNITSIKNNLIGLLLGRDYSQKTNEELYKMSVYKELDQDDKARELLQQIDAFNNPDLIHEAKSLSQRHITNGYTDAIPHHHTSGLIIEHMRDLINSHLTVEALRGDYYQLAV